MALLGAHASAAGGVENTIPRAEELGCEAVQIFSKNQRQWKAKPLSDESIHDFKERLEMSGQIRDTVIHDSYLINLANPDAEGLAKSREAFLDEMVRADQLDIPWLVFHPGAHRDSGMDTGIETIARSLIWALDRHSDGRVNLLLENTAGMGSHVGSRFEELAAIIDKVGHARLGVCLDTAHLFEAGYDLRDEAAYDKTFTEFDRIVGLDRLKVFHINDSKTELESHVDRHENIGEGKIGAEPFRLLVTDARFENHPMILETPGGDEFFKQNLELLKSYRKNSIHHPTTGVVMELNAFMEVIQFAIGKEKEAVEFYKQCADMSQRSGMKSAFLEMAGEEDNHVRMLENFKPEHVEKVKIKEIPDLKIGDYLVDLEFAPGMKYQDLLILAMKREEAAARMYQDLAREGGDPAIEKLFKILAQEELKHKNRLETEYDDTVLKDN